MARVLDHASSDEDLLSLRCEHGGALVSRSIRLRKPSCLAHRLEGIDQGYLSIGVGGQDHLSVLVRVAFL